MYQIWNFRKTILIFCFALVIFGCASKKNQQSNMNIGLKAEAAMEGIRLIFDNIPEETKRIFLSISESGEIENVTSPHELISKYSDIRDDSLEQVKQTGIVVFPFVKAGQKYSIHATLQNENFEDIASVYVQECIPYSGIYFGKGIELNLNETYSSVTLSSEPVFSAEVEYASLKYNYRASIDWDGANIGAGEKPINALTWNFEPLISDSLKEGNHLASGDYLVYITAFCNVIYDNLTWEVEIAKTNVFTFSL
jgi:hypothetical protein